VSGQYDVMQDLFVKGTVGTGFRLPSASELFVDYHEPGYNEVGNPKLRPEKSFNVNGSVGGNFGGFRWEVVGFYRTVTDLIDIFDDGTGTDTYTYYNTKDEVRFKGFELIGSAALGMDVVASGSFTYTQARVPGSKVQLQRIPETFGQGSLDWAPTNRPFGATITVAYTGDVHYQQAGTDVKYGNYAVVDFSARYYIDPDRKHRLKFRIANIFDEVYGQPRAQTDDFGVSFAALQLAPPRTFSIGYDFSF
jgi:vitamin B12 transporter